MTSPSQALAPKTSLKQNRRRSYYYPQARVSLSVVFETFGDIQAPRTFPVTPRAITIHNNSYKEADSFSLEFDARDLPVSPDLIKGGAAEIYLFQAQGIGQLPDYVKAKDSEDSPQLEGLEPSIVGIFDNVSMEFSSSGRMVTIDGTDYTSLFISKQWQTRPKKKAKGTSKVVSSKRVSTGKDLGATISSLMREVESADALQLVVIIPKGTSLPIVGSGESRAYRKGIPFKDAENYWDVMYALAARYGFILFVRNLNVILTTPKAYLEDRSDVRKMTWGKNLTSLRMSRKIGKEQVPTIEVRSYDSKARKIRKARYPKDRKQKPTTGLGTVKDEIRVMTVPGVQKESQLLQVAETAYNLLARAEQSIEIETMDLTDEEGRDLIELRTGDPLSIGFAPRTRDLLEAQSFSQRVQTLVGLGFLPQVAVVISSTFDKINQFKHPFRVKEATLEWGYESGLRIAASLQTVVNPASSGDKP